MNTKWNTVSVTGMTLAAALLMLSGCNAEYSADESILQKDEANEAAHREPLEQAGGNDALERDASIAIFENAEIDLSKDWGEANSCIIWRQGGVAECFRSEAEMSPLVLNVEEQILAEEHVDREAPDYNILACPACLHLYQDKNFKGRHLTFCDVGGSFKNLTAYGFNDKLSSYKTGWYPAHLAEHTGGKGYWYPGNTNACASISHMSPGWNDRVSSIKRLWSI